jgi:hypothetical protein
VRTLRSRVSVIMRTLRSYVSVITHCVAVAVLAIACCAQSLVARFTQRFGAGKVRLAGAGDTAARCARDA